MKLTDLINPGWVMLVAGLLGYFVRSTVEQRLAAGVKDASKDLVAKLDELKDVIGRLTVQLARMEEKHSSLAERVETIEKRLEGSIFGSANRHA